MIPEHRLVQLLDQIKQSQVSKCLYHNPSTPLSLFTDHMCDRNEFPLQTIKTLDEYEGEVWAVEFSHNGKLLAVCGSLHTVLIYDTSSWEIRHRLPDHTDSVVCLAWSPDDTKIITCGNQHDHKARVWDASVSHVMRLTR